MSERVKDKTKAKEISWQKIFHTLITKAQWKPEDAANLTPYQLRLLSVDETGLGGSRSLSPAEAKKLSETRKAARQAAMAVEAMNKNDRVE